MFHTIADFIHSWQEEAKMTEKLLSALSDGTLETVVFPDQRTLKQLSWHILTTPHEMLGRTGLKITGAESHTPAPKTVKEHIEAHRKVTQSVEHQVQTHWNNKMLHHTDDMYGEMWTRSQTLVALIAHLIHHRGQMTMLMRGVGLKVPGLYGPAKEEWQQYGMQPPIED